MPEHTSTLTHKDLAALVGVSETTIKSYRRKFRQFIPVHSQGKPIRFQARAAEVCQLIRSCFLEDRSVAEIRQQLVRVFPPEERAGGGEHIDTLSRSVELPKNGESAADIRQGLLAVRADFERMARLHAETNERLQRLHELFADYFTLQLGRDDALTSQVRDLHLRLCEALETGGLAEGATPIPEPAIPAAPERPEGESPARDIRPRTKVVTVRNMYGDESVYRLETRDAEAAAPVGAEPEPVQSTTPAQPAEAETDFWRAAEPPGRLLSLPLVVRSMQGEYLGIAGRSERSFCLNDFLDLTERCHPPPRHFSHCWERRDDAWRLSLEQGEVIRPLRYVLFVETVETPRGNAVTLLSQLHVDGHETPAPNLHAFIRRMRDSACMAADVLEQVSRAGTWSGACQPLLPPLFDSGIPLDRCGGAVLFSAAASPCPTHVPALF